MRLTFRYKLVLILIFSGIALALISTKTLSGQLTSEINSRATDYAQFKLPEQQIQGLALQNADLNNKVVILDFWASWCTPCREALPFYDELQKEFNHQGVQFIAVNVEDDAPSRDDFLKSLKISLPIFADGTPSLLEQFNIQVVPTLIILDQKRRLVTLKMGFNDSHKKELREKILELTKTP